MTRKTITLEFVVPTVIAIALGVLLSVGAVFVTDHYLGPADQPDSSPAAAGRR